MMTHPQGANPELEVHSIRSGLPVVERPFAVLIDSEDPEWAEPADVRLLGNQLLEAGCRYFVCAGSRCEEAHDSIDDAFIESGLDESIITTFHHDETGEEAAWFFARLASPGMKSLLVWVRNTAAWRATLAAALAEID